jgi:hypothetical protein
VTPHSLPFATNAAFNDFLYAAVGVDRKEMQVTVLSTLARQDLDPWTQAAELCGLPQETAIQRLTSMLPVLPGACSLAERRALAGHLIALLPDRLAAPGLVAKLTPRMPLASDEPVRGEVLFMAMLFMLLSQWAFLHAMDNAKTTVAAAAPEVAASTAAAPERTLGTVTASVGVK